MLEENQQAISLIQVLECADASPSTWKN
jgi:hypothetical protein